MFKFNYYDGGVLTGYEYEDFGKDYFVDEIWIVPKDDIESIEEVEDEE